MKHRKETRTPQILAESYRGRVLIMEVKNPRPKKINGLESILEPIFGERLIWPKLYD